MMTLDDVIEAMERCSIPHYFDCKGCPYEDDDAEVGCRSDDRDADALHYLKTYRENQQTYIENSRKAEEARERYLEAVKNCELAENKYRKLYEETSQNLRNTSQITCPKCHSEFVILPDANNPLSWDELRTMEGKPVWVEILSDEIDLSSRWMLVARETKAHSLPLAYTDDMGHWIYGHEDDLGKTWQAYRKEN